MALEGNSGKIYFLTRARKGIPEIINSKVDSNIFLGDSQFKFYFIAGDEKE